MTPFEFATGYLNSNNDGKPFEWKLEDLRLLCETSLEMYEILTALKRKIIPWVELVIAEMEPQK